MVYSREELVQEAIRLRVEQRLSLNEIVVVTGASKSSLSLWLKLYPLTADELRQRQKAAKRYVAPKKSRGEVSKFYQSVADRELSRQEKGKIAEAAVAFRLALQGFVVYASPYDGDKADWVVKIPETGSIYTLQVRWARTADAGLPYINLRCAAGHNTQRCYSEGDFDFIIGYDLYSDTAFVYSANEVALLKATVSMKWDHAERWDKLRV